MMLSKATQPRLSRAFLLLLVVLIALAAIGCSAAPSRGWSGPLVSDNVLYVGTLQGKILALDLPAVTDSGGDPSPLWTPKELPQPSSGGGFGCYGSYSRPAGVYGMPAVNDGRIYIGAYGGEVLWITTDGKAVSDPTFKTDGDIVGSVVIDGETLYVGTSGGTLYAISLDLKEKWHFETKGEIWSTPVVKHNVVYVASADHNLYAIDAESGKEIWRFETKAAIMSTPLVANGRVYIGSCDRRFYAIEAATEEERLVAATGASPGLRQFQAVFEGAANWFWTQALLHNGEVWVGCLDHKVYVLDAETLNHIADIKTEGMVYAPPVLFPAEGLVVVGSQDGRLYVVNSETKDVTVYAIDAKTEQVLVLPEKPKNWSGPILAPMYADTANGIVYLHAQNGKHTLYAFKLATREVLWSFRTDKIS